MFYLLEDNPTGIRILDDKNNEIEHIQIKDMKDEMKMNSYSSIKVIKYSENVFDLIENGDCYLYQNKHMIKPEICLINDDILLNIFKSRADETPETIFAIYKPNSRGDYIKVWEKKEKVVE